MCAGFTIIKGRGSSCNPCDNSSLPPRSTKKSGIFDFLKKVLENNPRGQTKYESSIGAYRKYCDIAAADEKSQGTDTVSDVVNRKASGSSEHSSRKKSSQTDSGPKPVTPSGLENLGNTCYLNAILQCLRSTELVRTYCSNFEGVIRKQSKWNGDLFPAFAHLIMEMHSAVNGSIGCSAIQKFRNAFTKFVPCYNGNLQQDALEFFTYLLDALHEEIKDRPNTPVVNDSVPLRSVSTMSPPSLSVLHTKFKRRHRLRMGGLKYSDSSIQLTSVEGTEAKAVNGDVCDYSKPPVRKWSRFSRLKSANRFNGVPCDEPLLDIFQPAMSSAETTASENSFLKDTFVGHLQTQLLCLQCTNVTTRDELFWNLALCVPEVSSCDKTAQRTSSSSSTSSNATVDTSITLDDCLSAFTKTEILDGLDKPFCANCKMHTKARLRVMISQLPRILVLQFQRFESTCCKTKKKHLIKFDFEQDVAPYCTNDFVEAKVNSAQVKASTLPQCDDRLGNTTPKSSVTASPSLVDIPSSQVSMNYRLYAVVYHQGGTQRGHYTARCHLSSIKSNTAPDTWFFFDDENVSRVADVNDVIQPTAYILFYKRIDNKADDSSSLCTGIQDDVSLTKISPVKFMTGNEEG